MSERIIQITQPDREKLLRLIEAHGKRNTRDQQHLEMLAEELERAEVVQPYEISADAVTMHSRVLVRDLNNGVESSYTLVFPADADITQGKISILAPIATALLGYREGDEIGWPTPGGWRRLMIVKVLYQPEAAGDEPGTSAGLLRQRQGSERTLRGAAFADA